MALLIVAPLGGQEPLHQVPLRVVGLEYPRLANIAHVQGKVELLAKVLPDGKVGNITTMSGHPLLAAASQETLTKWRFAPCSPARNCDVGVTFSYVLTEKCDHSCCTTEFAVDLVNLAIEVRAKTVPPMID